MDIELEEPKSKPKMVDLELTSEEQLSKKLWVEALEDFALFFNAATKGMQIAPERRRRSEGCSKQTQG